MSKKHWYHDCYDGTSFNEIICLDDSANFGLEHDVFIKYLPEEVIFVNYYNESDVKISISKSLDLLYGYEELEEHCVEYKGTNIQFFRSIKIKK